MKRPKEKSKINPNEVESKRALFENVLECWIKRCTTIRAGLAISEMREQYRCPTGCPGGYVARLMNQGHKPEPLPLWD